MSEEIENKNGEEKQETEDNVIDSGAEGVSADDWYKNTPVFDVNKNSFFQNMRLDRNKTRFANGTKPSQFMKGTKYRKPFYVRFTDSSGEQYLNKFK